jgi:hypothetical protein
MFVGAISLNPFSLSPSLCTASAMPSSKPARSPRPRFFIRPAARNRQPRRQNSSSVYNTYLCEPSWCSSPSALHCAQPARMSSITPQSFVDDGSSFAKRVPHGLDQRWIAKWISGDGSEVSGYTGSYIDDGADMLLPQRPAPGFGKLDTKFYKQRKRKEEKDALWNDDVQKAISGDIQRNLAKLQGLGGVEIKKPTREHPVGQRGGKEESQEKKKDTVTIPMPPQWGTFVIKGDDGRVIIVGKDGEFDSGPQKAPSERLERWVKAASTVPSHTPTSPTAVSVPRSPPKHEAHSITQKQRIKEKEKDSKHQRRKHKHKKSHHSHLTIPPKALTPIPESEYEDGYLPSGGEQIWSPTGFMMTGGASGRPSKAATSVASPASSVGGGYEYMLPASTVKTISQGYRYVIPDSDGYEYAIPGSPIKSKPSSPVRSPPGGWPSPPVSPVKSKNKSKTSSEQSWSGSKYEDAWKVASPAHSNKSERSHRSHKSEKLHRSGKHEFDTHSVKSHSTYRAPTVEDAPNTSSEEKDYIKTGWGGSVDAGSAKSCESSKKGSHRGPSGSKHGSASGRHSPAKPASKQSWNSRLKAADNPSWPGIEPSSFEQHPTSLVQQHFGSPARPASEATWDGFEKPKSSSDVSVFGTGSERSELGSRVSRSSRVPSHGNHRSYRSSRHEQPVGWEGAGGSQTSYRRQRGGRYEQATGWEVTGSHRSRESHQSHQSANSEDRTGWEDGGSRVSHESRNQTDWAGGSSQASWTSEKQVPHNITWEDTPAGGVEKSRYANGFDEDNATYLNENWGGVPVRIGSRARSSRRKSVVGWE